MIRKRGAPVVSPGCLQLRMRVRRRKHIALHRGPAPVPPGADGAVEHGLRPRRPRRWATVSRADRSCPGRFFSFRALSIGRTQTKALFRTGGVTQVDADVIRACLIGASIADGPRLATSSILITPKQRRVGSDVTSGLRRCGGVPRRPQGKMRSI